MGWLDTVKDVGGAIADVAEDAWEEVEDAGEELLDDAGDAWDDFTGDCEDAWFDFTRNPNPLTLLAGVFSTVGAIVDLGANAVGALAGFAVSIVGAVVGLVVGVVVSVFSPEHGPLVAGAIMGFAGKVGDWVEAVVGILGNVAQWILSGVIAGGLLWISDYLRCARGYVTGGSRPSPTTFSDIEHVFVVMFENRSFDHVLGQLRGVDGWSPTNPHSNHDLQGGVVEQRAAALQSLNADPPHEFSTVQLQVEAGRSTDGFAKVWQRHLIDEGDADTLASREQVMAGFSPERAPILNTLAEEFAVCDRWFSSIPGPTYPNRLFAYAGESGGLADSPHTPALIGSYIDGVSFANGSLFDLLDLRCRSWRVYSGDRFPMVNTLKRIFSSPLGDHRRISPTDKDDDDFEKDLRGATERFPSYVFIEPDYGKFWTDFKGGNSQHPLDTLAAGEALLKHIYESLRASPIWERSMLIVTYDEHGGFYDHVTPPTAIAPSLDDRHRHLQDDIDPGTYSPSRYGGISLTHTELDPKKFAFDRLGVRVPAVVVSPLIPRGTVSHDVFDHTSIIRTVCDLQGLDFLAQRDRTANSLRRLFVNGAVRPTPTSLPTVNQN